MRIVSFLSSATEIVYALGLQDQLVAISHECDYPDEALHLPRVSRSRFDPAGLTSGEVDTAVRAAMAEHGSVYEVDEVLLRELSPDLILTQGICEVCAVPVGSVDAAIAGLDEPPAVLSLDAHSLDDIITSVERVAEAAGRDRSGRELSARMRERLERVTAAISGRPRPRTLLMEWLNPPFAPGHWVPEMVELAGGENLTGGAGERSMEIRWAELDGLDPDVLLIEPCGYGLGDARLDADAHRPQLERIAARAMASDRVWLLDSAYFSRSGPRVVDGVEALAAVLHPEAELAAPGQRITERW